MRWSTAIAVVAAAVLLSGRLTSARFDDLPSGERQLGRTVIEPAYDDRNGNIIYLSTPIGAPFPSKSNPKAWSPLYLVEYPNSASAFAGTMNCAHQPADNCPDHGPGIAGPDRDRVFDLWINVKQSVQPNDANDLRYRAMHIGELHIAAEFLHSRMDSHQHSEPHAGDVRQSSAVQDELLAAAEHLFRHALQQVLAVGLVDHPFEDDGQDIAVLTDLLVLEVEHVRHSKPARKRAR